MIEAKKGWKNTKNIVILMTFIINLRTEHELLPTQQLDVVYDPSLTLARIRAELDKKVSKINAGVIIVDYINQVKGHIFLHEVDSTTGRNRSK